jgi:multiple sugar transport system substrate-binding protein
LFKKAGLNPNNPPTTWQELAQDAVKLTQWNGSKLEVSGFAAPNGTDTEMIMNFFIQLLWQGDGHIFNADRTKVDFASPQGVAALQFYADLFHKYKVNQIGFGAGTEGTQAPFYRDKAAMIMAGSYDLVTLKQMPNIHFKVALLPSPPGGKSVSLIDSFSIFMPKQAKHKNAAWDFIKYATSEQAQVNFSKTSQRLPATAEAVKDPYFTRNPILQVFAHAISTGRAMPIVPQWVHIQNVLVAEIQKVLAGQESAKTALDNVDNTVNNQIL